MRLFPLLLLAILYILTACSSDSPGAVVELDSGAIPTITPRIVFVTPTQEPTPIPTVDIATPIPTLAPITASSTPDLREAESMCTANLETLFTQASEFCLGEPGWIFL